MNGKFVMAKDVKVDEEDWGTLGWHSLPAIGATALTFIEVALKPGKGHDFHKHPDQEEVIYVAEGEIEQWLEQKKTTLRAGDSVFIGKGVVHASFNVSGAPVKLLVSLGPCVGDSGYEVVDVAGDAPWSSLR